jgi:FMN-dependent NADH-azoreductase
MNILQINSSIRGDASVSTQLAARLAERMPAAEPTSTLVVRDLGKNPHPVLDEAAITALYTPADKRLPEQAARVALDDALIAELQAADVVVVAAPMYNFGISALLKNWIDAVARNGVTFRYSEKGPEGLLKGKKLYVVLARGGKYRDTPMDSQVPYLRTVFGFLGITDIEFIYAEGLNMGPDVLSASIEWATSHIDSLVRSVTVAKAA